MTIDSDDRPEDDDPRSGVLAAARAALGAEIVPMAGGRLSGETFLVALPGEAAVLRLYVRDPGRAEVDVSLARLLRAVLPVPQVLDWRPPGPDGRGAFVLTELAPGSTLDSVLPTADAALLERLGASVGAVLARLSAMPYLYPGTFSGPELALQPMSRSALDLESWVGERLSRPPLDDWPAEVRRRVAVAASSSAHHLDTVDRTCLVHGGFNPANLLVDTRTGTVTGLVDWVDAHAGLPVTDLGRMLRSLEPSPFTTAMLAEFRSAAPPLPPFLIETAAGADLFALSDLAARSGDDVVVVAARDALWAIAAGVLD